MVSSISIVSMFVALLISVLFPVGLIIYFYRKYKISITALVIGALVFIVFQAATRIPLLGLLSRTEFYRNLSNHIVLFSFFLGITAALFENIGRYLGMRFLLKNQLEWKNGVAFGIGHGGVEAILLVGMANINNIVYSFMINAGIFDTAVGSKLPTDVSEAVKSSLITTPAHMFIAGGVERILVIIIQIALSLIVLYAVMNKKYIHLLTAILFHTLIDTVAAIMSMSKVNIWLIELYVLAFSVLGLIFIIKSKKLLMPPQI